MDRERIEELRRKLRSGRKVRIVNGNVLMADEAPPAQAGALVPSRHGALAAQSNSGDDGAPGQAGRTPGGQDAPAIAVKPHEWGAVGAESADEQRLMVERDLLARFHPSYSLDVDDDGTLFAHGLVGPTNVIEGRYHVLIELPPGYGRGVMPRAYVLEPPLRPDAPHRFADGSLCLDHSGAFTARSTLVTFCNWVAVWLALYESFASTGVRW